MTRVVMQGGHVYGRASSWEGIVLGGHGRAALVPTQIFPLRGGCTNNVVNMGLF